MNKVILAQYRRGTPEWVVAHGMWQHSRGRRPSERWGEIANPQKAFDAAMAAILVSNPRVGSMLEYHVKWMVRMANLVHKQVQTNFNGILVRVSPGDRADMIIEKYMVESQRRSDAYWNSPEGREQARRNDESRARAVAAMAEGIKSFELTDPDGWQLIVAQNSDPYSAGVVRYAARWANMMEARMANGEELEDIASDTSDEADAESITGFMYGCAVQILADVWAHGESLRRWHNLDVQRKDEGERANESGGVLNPALLVISA